MLQIASGKLFKRQPRETNELRGVFYANLQSHRGNSVETKAGQIYSTTDIGGVQAFVYEITELIEDDPRVSGLVSHTVRPYLEDFATVASFAMNATCIPDFDSVRRLTQNTPSLLIRTPHKQFVKRVFDDEIWCQEEDEENLVNFVDQLIGLKRKSFLAVMQSIRTYVAGVRRLTESYETAYTLLVASIESLAQGFDGHTATWQDYQQSRRQRIDRALKYADRETAEAVRQAILENEYTAIGRRFREFALDHLQPSFFREEAAKAKVDSPVGKADIRAALPQVYDLRSRYLHGLEKLPTQLTLPLSDMEAAYIGGRTFLTFQGLSRLARHVITTFIERQPKVDHEEYDYNEERLGIVRLPTAPQYWIGSVEGLEDSSGRRRLEGFLEQIANPLQGDDGPAVTDLVAVLSKLESRLPNMASANSRPFLTLYILFNRLVLDDKPMENFQAIQERHSSEFEGPSLESALIHLLTCNMPTWDLHQHQEVHDAHISRKGRLSSLKIPDLLEAGLTLQLAERYRAAGLVEAARKLVSVSVDNYPGHGDLRSFEQGFDPTQSINWQGLIFPRQVVESK